MSDCLLCPMPMNYEMMTSIVNTVQIYCAGGMDGYRYFHGTTNTHYFWWPVELEQYNFWDISVPALNCQIEGGGIDDVKQYVNVTLKVVVARGYGNNPNLISQANSKMITVRESQVQSFTLSGLDATGVYGEGKTLAIGIELFAQSNGARVMLTVNNSNATVRFYN